MGLPPWNSGLYDGMGRRGTLAERSSHRIYWERAECGAPGRQEDHIPTAMMPTSLRLTTAGWATACAQCRQAHCSKPRMTPRVLQTIREPLSTVKVVPRTKNEATPRNSGRVILSVLVMSLDAPIGEGGTRTTSETVCRIIDLRSVLGMFRRSA